MLHTRTSSSARMPRSIGKVPIKYGMWQLRKSVQIVRLFSERYISTSVTLLSNCLYTYQETYVEFLAKYLNIQKHWQQCSLLFNPWRISEYTSLFMLHFRTAYFIFISGEKDIESHYFLHKYNTIPTIGFERKMSLRPY
jgi:hypothetical protein